MIKLFSLKDQARTQDGANRNAQKTTAAQLRITKDISEMDLPTTLRMDIPENDLQNLKLIVAPDEGDYRGGKFSFSIKISNAYPHEPPKVKCEQRIYHPNIDYEGNVCLNILREDWKPVLTLSSVVYGLHFLFVEPNAEDPLNKEAADLMVRNHGQFIQHVNEAMKGRSVGGLKYDKVL